MTNFAVQWVYAERLDALGPLAEFRHRFVQPDDSLIYLDVNSLGPLPHATRARIAEELPLPAAEGDTSMTLCPYCEWGEAYEITRVSGMFLAVRRDAVRL